MSLIINNKLPWDTISGYNGWYSTYFAGDVDIYPTIDSSFNITGTGDLVIRRGNAYMSISSYIYAYNLNCYGDTIFNRQPKYINANLATELYAQSTANTYVTNNNNNILFPALLNYATVMSVSGTIINYLRPYPTLATVNSILSGYAMLNDIPTDYLTFASISNYVTKDYLATTLSNYSSSSTTISSGVTLSYLNTYYATKEFLKFSISGLVSKPTNTNTSFGLNCLDSNLTGTYNTCYGGNSGTSITGGIRNCLYGYNSGGKISNGQYNTYIGMSSMQASNTSDAYFNTAIGGFTGTNYSYGTICGSILIGYGVNLSYGATNFNYATAIGYLSKCAVYSTTLGAYTVCNNIYSTCIGYGATSDSDNQIVLGTVNEFVYCPNNLQVQNSILTNDLQVNGTSNFLGNLPTFNGTDSFATQPYVKSYVTDYYTSTISNYIKTRGYATQAYVNASIPSLTGYATQAYVNNSISGLATYAYVNSRGGTTTNNYYTVSGYATTNYVDSKVANLGNNAYLYTLSGDAYVTNDLIMYGSIQSTIGNSFFFKNCKYGDPNSFQFLQPSSYSQAFQNTAIGVNNLSNITIGSGNSGCGAYALDALTSGSFNSCFGGGAGNQLVGGSQNVSVGYQSLYQTSKGNNNVAIGYASLNGGGVFQSYENTFIGSKSGYNASYTISGNVVIGYMAGNNIQSNYNVLIGYNSSSPNGNTLYGTHIGAFTNGNDFKNSSTLGAFSQSTSDFQITLGTKNEYVFTYNLTTSGTTYFKKLPMYSTPTTNYNMATESFVTNTLTNYPTSSYLTSNYSTTSYLTSNYSTTSTCNSTYAPLSNPTFIGTATIPTVSITSGTASTSTTTGALKVSGGVGVTGDVYVGGSVYTNSVKIGTIISNTTSYALTNPTVLSLNSLSLTTGAWVVTFNCRFRNLPTSAFCSCSLSPTVNVIDTASYFTQVYTSSISGSISLTRIVNITSNVVYYSSIEYTDKTGGGATANGDMLMTAIKIA